ncbi:hypothetical protein GF358_03370 [Candidatus Woesearchaeota archaeon]|nr:hypothetical protein [Candidatus Woesearchaeota archaeon]
MNLFSGHMMAQNIMMQTSPTLQMNMYLEDFKRGTDVVQFYPERLDWMHESRKMDFTPAFKPIEADPYLYQAKLEERFENQQLFRGLELISKDRIGRSHFDKGCVLLAEQTFNINRQKDSSELMLSFLEHKRQFDFIPADFSRAPDPFELKTNLLYARDTLDLTIPARRPIVPVGFASWVRDTLDEDVNSFLMPVMNLGDAIQVRDRLDIDFTENFKPVVMSLPTETPGVRNMFELTSSGLRPFTGDPDYTREFRMPEFNPPEPLMPRYEIPPPLPKLNFNMSKPDEMLPIPNLRYDKYLYEPPRDPYADLIKPFIDLAGPDMTERLLRKIENNRYDTYLYESPKNIVADVMKMVREPVIPDMTERLLRKIEKKNNW